MAHFPVNHPARPLYRAFAALVGLYILVFGVVGTVATWGEPLFARDGDWILGLRTNRAFALVSIVFGVVLLVGASRRGNLGHYMNLTAGVVFMVTGLAMMTVLQTDANFLNFSMSTVVVSLLFGLLLLATGLYDKIGPDEREAADERAGREPDERAGREWAARGRAEGGHPVSGSGG